MNEKQQFKGNILTWLKAEIDNREFDKMRDINNIEKYVKLTKEQSIISEIANRILNEKFIRG